MESILALPFFEELLKWTTQANSFLWGTKFLIPLLCGTGIFFTLRLGFVQVSKFGMACRKLFSSFSLFEEKAHTRNFETLKCRL